MVFCNAVHDIYTLILFNHVSLRINCRSTKNIPPSRQNHNNKKILNNKLKCLIYFKIISMWGKCFKSCHQAKYKILAFYCLFFSRCFPRPPSSSAGVTALSVHYTTLHSSTLLYTSLPYPTLHYASLHYPTLHYTTPPYLCKKCTIPGQPGQTGHMATGKHSQAE